MNFVYFIRARRLTIIIEHLRGDDPIHEETLLRDMSEEGILGGKGAYARLITHLAFSRSISSSSSNTAKDSDLMFSSMQRAETQVPSSRT